MLCAFALMLLAGCTSNADVLPSPSPAATTLMPSPSILPSPMLPGTSPGTTPTDTTAPGQTGAEGVTTIEQAQQVSEDVTTELEKLSEVDTAAAVVMGKTAVAGLTFDSQYKGGLTTRIKDMVKDRVNTVQTGIDNVAVTVLPEQVKAVQDLAAKLKDGGDKAAIQTQVEALYKNIMSNSTSTTAP